jgi:putative hydrolase of the HAD superfamily
VAIQNIIFDLGGVLLNIDYFRTVEAFKNLGLKDPEKAFTKEVQADLFQKFEKGEVSSEGFLLELSKHMPGAGLNEIEDAWNALLLEFPFSRYTLLKKLSRDYKLYLLSNTNAIHEKAFKGIIDDSVGWTNFESLFRAIGYSHQLGERKPNLKVFELVLKKNGLSPEHTLFIDDTIDHVLSALKLGIRAVHLSDDLTLEEILRREL